MENDKNEIFDMPAGENTEDLSFLAKTSVLEQLSQGDEPEPGASALSETQVFEKLTADSETPRREESKNTGKEKEESAGGLRSSAMREVLLFFRDLAICMTAVLLTVNYILRPIQVKGSSMYPTLTDGSLGVSNLLGYSMDGIRRFDIVIVYMESKNEYLVKRCVGLPGETISYSGGTLYVNGEAVEEEFLGTDYALNFDEGVFMADMEPITLGADEYLCLGDNRPHSTDSRYYGPFRKEQIVSKGIFILFPFSGFGVHTW